MNKLYAGIGSRTTPGDILQIMTLIANALAQKDYILRSGGAKGADSAFWSGCTLGGGEGWMYEGGYEQHVCHRLKGHSPSQGGTNKFEHQYYGGYNLGQAAEVYVKHGILTMDQIQQREEWWWRLVGRNVFQILGLEPMTNPDPVAFVIYWAPEHYGNVTGGTRYAVNLAEKLGIKTYNLLHPDTFDMTKKWLKI